MKNEILAQEEFEKINVVKTYEELTKELEDNTTLNQEMKSEMLSMLNGQYQFIFNLLHKEHDEEMTELVARPDNWEKGYNSFVEIYQKYEPI